MAEANQCVQGDLQVRDVVAGRALLAFLKLHEEDALCRTLVILGIRFWTEVALPVLPLLLHLGRGQTTKTRTSPFRLAVLQTSSRARSAGRSQGAASG